MRTTAICNLKGGVAKTITTAAMADILGMDHGKRVLVIDADSQGNLSRYFGVEAVFWTEPIIDLTAAAVSTTFFMTCSGRILKKRLEVGKERMHMRQA